MAAAVALLSVAATVSDHEPVPSWSVSAALILAGFGVIGRHPSARLDFVPWKGPSSPGRPARTCETTAARSLERAPRPRSTHRWRKRRRRVAPQQLRRTARCADRRACRRDPTLPLVTASLTAPPVASTRPMSDTGRRPIYAARSRGTTTRRRLRISLGYGNGTSGHSSPATAWMSAWASRTPRSGSSRSTSGRSWVTAVRQAARARSSVRATEALDERRDDSGPHR